MLLQKAKQLSHHFLQYLPLRFLSSSRPQPYLLPYHRQLKTQDSVSTGKQKQAAQADRASNEYEIAGSNLFSLCLLLLLLQFAQFFSKAHILTKPPVLQQIRGLVSHSRVKSLPLLPHPCHPPHSLLPNPDHQLLQINHLHALFPIVPQSCYYIINRPHMKLQIMGRLSKKEKFKHDNLKEIIQGNHYLTEESLEKYSRIEEFSTIKTEETLNHHKEEKDTLRGFFDNFELVCEVRYEPVEQKNRKVKRKLAPALELLKQSANNKQSRASKDKKGNAKPASKIENPAKQPCKNEGKKVRKANSLLSIDRSAYTSTTKPKNAKLDKSICKKQPTPKGSKLTENKENCDPKARGSKLSTKRNSKEIDQSKEWFNLMMRQINEIYELRKSEGNSKSRIR